MYHAFSRLCLLLPYLVVLPIAATSFWIDSSPGRHHVDETGWARASLSLYRLLAAGDFSPSSWQFSDDAAYGSFNPPLGKLLFALPVVIGCIEKVDEPGAGKHSYDASVNLEENRARSAVAPEEILYPMRWVSACFGIAFVLVCMAMLHRAFGALSAFLAGLVLSSNPTVILISTTILTDLPYQFMVFATGLCGMVLASRRSPRQRTQVALLMAVFMGLATSTKYAAMPLLIPFFLGILVVLGVTRGMSRRRLQITAMASIIVAAAVPFLLNPYFWPEVSTDHIQKVKRDWKLLQHGELEIPQGQAVPVWLHELHVVYSVAPEPGGGRRMTLTPNSLASLHDHLLHNVLHFEEAPLEVHPKSIVPALYGLSRPLQLPLIYLRWAAYREWVTHEWDWSPSRATFARYYWSRHIALPNEGWLALLGLLALLLTPDPRRLGMLSEARALACFGIISMGMLYLTRLEDYERYLAALFVLRIMAASVGVVFLGRVALKAVAKAYALWKSIRIHLRVWLRQRHGWKHSA